MFLYLSWCHLSYDVITIMEPLVLSVNLSLCIYIYGYILIMRGWQAESNSPATETLYTERCAKESGRYTWDIVDSESDLNSIFISADLVFAWMVTYIPQADGPQEISP